MVDPKAAVLLPGSFAVIPPGKFLRVAVHFSKEVGESPLFDVIHRGAFGLCEMQLSLPGGHAPYIEIVHRNIEIAAEQDIRIQLTLLVEHSSQTL